MRCGGRCVRRLGRPPRPCSHSPLLTRCGQRPGLGLTRTAPQPLAYDQVDAMEEWVAASLLVSQVRRQCRQLGGRLDPLRWHSRPVERAATCWACSYRKRSSVGRAPCVHRWLPPRLRAQSLPKRAVREAPSLGSCHKVRFAVSAHLHGVGTHMPRRVCSRGDCKMVVSSGQDVFDRYPGPPS